MIPVRPLLLVTLLLLCLTACAVAAEPSKLDAVRVRLQQDFPRLTVTDLQPSPVEGMFAVTSGLDILYYFPDSGHLLNGNLYYKTGENLTQKAVDALRETVVAGLPLESAVKIGSGPTRVIEITDPDCPYCRKASAFFDDKDNLVTRYVFFFPLSQLHPKAAAKAAWILAAEDGAAAYHAVMNGTYDKTPLPEFKDNGRLATHQAVAQQLGVRGTPQFFLKGQHVGGANIAELSKLLGLAPPQPLRPTQAPKAAPGRP